MDLLTSLRMSWRALSDHKLRSTLTTLGVIIGVGAVITFVTLGASLQADVVRTLAGENTDVMYVSVSSQEGASIPTVGGGGPAVFTQHDVNLLRGVEGVAAVIPEGAVAAAGIEYRNDTVGRQLITVTSPRYFRAKGHDIVEGRTFQEGRQEVVLNRRAAGMFEENVSVGENVTIVRGATGERLNATVVGIVREGEPEDGSGQPLVATGNQPAIYAPPDPYYDRTVVSPSTEVDQHVYPRLLVVAEDAAELDAVQGRVQAALADHSDARVLKPEGYRFEVTTHDEMVDEIERISSTFTAYIVGVAVISLIVGAIGIANIMLANVAERRREIGIMKAIGGDNRDVLQLFLNEAVLLGVLGSLLGAAVGTLGAWVATALIGLPFVLDPAWFLVAVGVGVGVGVTSGIYPAWSAARTDPIDALRHE